MMARAHPKLALRPFLPADVTVLAEIFRASIDELTADDYSESQREAWAAMAEDEAGFCARLAKASARWTARRSASLRSKAPSAWACSMCIPRPRDTVSVVC